MKTVKWIQLIWSGLAALAINPLTVRPGLEQNPQYFVGYVWLYFAVTICCCIRPWRFAWWMAVILPIAPLIYMSPFMGINAWLVLTWQKPYRDDPTLLAATFLVLVPTVLPSLAIYYFLFCDRREVARTLLNNKHSRTHDAPMQ